LNRKIIILGVVLILSQQSFGQGSSDRAAYKSVLRGKWDKAYAQLTKSIRKDSLNAGTSYVLAFYFFEPENPHFHLDSAHYYIRKAFRVFYALPPRDRDKLARNAIDSISLVALNKQIDSSAFSVAREADSETAYLDFLQHYDDAEFVEEAKQLRDEAAFRDAVTLNTYQAFEDFIARYPGATHVPDARSRYEALLYADQTKDKKLASYERYLRQNPQSPYLHEVEQAIFEIRTAPGTPESFIDYLERNGSASFARRAIGILFHLAPVERRQQDLETWLTDSLRAVIRSDLGYLVPILREGRFGFMDQEGQEVIQPDQQQIGKDYLCGHVTDDVIVLQKGLVTSTGAVIAEGEVSSMDEIGAGFMLATFESCTRLIHKTGFYVGDCVQDAKVIGDQFLGVQIDSQWSLWTFGGRELMPPEWDNIEAIGDLLVLSKSGQYQIATTRVIADIADQGPLSLTDPVDEVRRWRNKYLWVRKGENEGLLDASLRAVSALAPRRLAPTYFGATSTSSGGVTTINDGGHESENFRQIQIRQPWTAVRTDNAWRLYDPLQRSFLSPAFDSIAFEGLVPIGMRGDSARYYFSTEKFMDLAYPAQVTFVPGRDSTAFLLVMSGKKKILYSLAGKRLIEVPFDRIEHAGGVFYVVSRKEKKGLIDATGKVLLPVEYDAIGSVADGVVTLLKNGRFGLFDGTRRKLIRPLYDKNVTRYNRNYNVVYKEGHYGFVDWDNKSLGKTEYAEVVYWNDSSALVRSDFVWKIIEMRTRRVLLDNIRKFQFIRDQGDDRLAIVQQDHNYGVIDNQTGTVIPISFSDLINVGSPDLPLYFTEKHVEEASLFVVIYYDASGKMLRREVYEDDDYDRIYCAK
jgi:hypothetical protein